MEIADHWEKTEGQNALEAAATAQETATAAQTFIGTCSTDAATAAKTVTGVTGFTLAPGVCIAVTFTNANTAASPTLNVNAKGAKPIMLNGAAYAYWVAGATVQFVYDGTSWQVCNVPLYGATATIGNPAGGNVYTDSDSVSIRNISDVLLQILARPSSGASYSIIQSAANSLALRCPDGGTIHLGTYDPDTGAASDYGMGLSDGVARIVASGFSYNSGKVYGAHILYDSSVKELTSLTLSSNYTLYDIIEVFFGRDSVEASVRFCPAHDSRAAMFLAYTPGTNIRRIGQSTITFSGATATISDGYFMDNLGESSAALDTIFSVWRIVGYK